MENYGSAQPNLEQRWKNIALSTLSLRVHPDQRRAASGRCDQKSTSRDEPRFPGRLTVEIDTTDAPAEDATSFFQVLVSLLGRKFIFRVL
jgi:hypothetical protein